MFPYENQGKQYVKPPLGLVPRDIWLTQRLIEVIEAIDRYQKANQKVPAAWSDEYRALHKEVIDHEKEN